MGRRRSKSAAAAALMFVVTSFVVTGASSQTASATLAVPLTAAFLDPEQGNPLLETRVEFSDITSDTWGPDMLRFNLTTVGYGYTLLFRAPPGETLAVGTYDDAVAAPVPVEGHPGLDVFGPVGCNSVSGRFVVDQIELNELGAATVFSARFEHHCNDHELVGAISYNATADYRVHSISAGEIDFGESNGAVIAGGVVTVSNRGPSTLAVTTAIITGEDASDFLITENGCVDVTLAVGQSCTVKVVFSPTGGVGERHAKLALFDDIAPLGGTGRDVPLTGERVTAFGEFTSLTPARVLDTRDGTGRGGLTTPVGAGETIDVQITGRGGVAASDVAAVVLNATVTQPTRPSFLTIWPSGVARPVISNLNYVSGQTVPNLVTVAVGRDGKVSAYNLTGTAHVIFDVVGFYADDTGIPGSRFHAIGPYRFFDTRSGQGGIQGPIGPAGVIHFNVLGRPAVPSTGVTAVVLNVTATQPSTASYLTVYPDDVDAPPLASNLNFVKGQTVPNLVTVRVPPSGIIDFYNAFGTVHVIADVVGYYDGNKSSEGGRFIPLVPTRTLDTRETDEPLGPDEYNWLEVAGWNDVPTSGAASVVLNTTVTQPTAPSYLTVFPDDVCDIPLASNLNYLANQTVANLVIVRLSINMGACLNAPGSIDFYNQFGTVHIIADVFGYFTDTSVVV